MDPPYSEIVRWATEIMDDWQKLNFMFSSAR